MGGQLDDTDGVDEGDLEFEPPTIWKPAALWSGKQVISTVLTNLVKGLPPITTSGKGKVIRCKCVVSIIWGSQAIDLPSSSD